MAIAFGAFMRKQSTENWPQRRVHRSQDGLEFYNYPSALAQKYWYYVVSLGRAKIQPGYRPATAPKEGFLLHYVRRGAVWHSVHGLRRDVGPGSVCLMDYSENNEHGTVGTKEAHVWWVLFDGRDLPHLFTELRADRDPVFTLVDPRRFEALFLELLALTQTRPQAYEAKSFATLAALLAELFAARAEREYQVSLVGRKAVLSEPVRKGIDYMTRFNSNPSLGLKDVCYAAGLSLRHFMRVFRSEVGMTPLQYLNRYRVEQAKHLLISSDKTMEQIARLVGASNQNYFSYLFRKQTGTTPRDYQASALRRAARI
jgi:AraC-like DNA-binding protein